MRLVPTPESLGAAAANVYDSVIGRGVADLRPLPASIIDEGPNRTVYRYLPQDERDLWGAPVLLVPPLAAPALCFDLRRGCSVAEHLMAAGHPTYLVDYGSIAFGDRSLGIEHWIDEVVPEAIAAVSAEHGGRPVQLVGWCLGGILSLLVAAGGKSPIRSVAMVASPFDFTQVPMVAPLRPLVNLTGGALGTVIYRALGGAPAPIVKRAFQLSSIDKYLTKPLVIAMHLDDREFLAQIEAVDRFTNNMLAYPGRMFGQLYHRFFRSNDLAAGHLDLGGEDTIQLADVRVPVMSVAGTGDGIAPLPAVHHVGGLLPNAPSVRLESAPGGHLGVLTGRSAAGTTWNYLDEFLTEHGEERSRALRAVA
jgi:polyhydroxyalkanoate synthase